MTEDTAGGPPRGALETDMPTLVPATSDRPGPGPNRRLLGRDQILREAVRLIDDEGRDRLTMRRLGSELGVEAMALYRYIPGREQLLDGVVEYVMNELYQKTMKDRELPGSWQEYLQQMAHGVRDIAVAHPRVFPLVATRPPAAPWLRPPLRSLRWVEGFLSSLHRFGFTDSKSVGIYRGFSTFLLGHLLLESATLDLGAEEELDDDIEFFETNDLSQYPRLMAVADLLKDDGHGTEFEDALEDLLDRIELVFD
jgi:AcrR family transcriptional regulator